MNSNRRITPVWKKCTSPKFRLRDWGIIDIPLYIPTKSLDEEKRAMYEAYSEDNGDYRLLYADCFLVLQGARRGMLIVHKSQEAKEIKDD